MKKLYLVLVVLISAISYAADIGDIGPSYSTTTVVVDRPGLAKQNCLTNLTISGSNFPVAGFTISVIDGGLTTGSTVYAITSTTGPVVQSWNYNSPLCVTHNSSMTITATHGTATGRVSYKGYIRDSR